MQNGYKIFWTDRAVKDFLSIVTYLEKNWTEKELKNFIARLDKRLNLISINPKLFPKTQIKESIRRSVLTKQLTIYYFFDNKEVKIIALFDTRQNSSKLKV
ncbi:MAG: type II toxin-antitoxin system RelE/ParE family toxin [Ignavibacteriaceae bacterium]